MAPSSPGVAQPADAIAPADAADAADAYFDAEEEVVRVTVDRREKDLQDYSGSATALSEDDLKRMGVTTVRNMSAATPYVEIGTQEGNTEIFVRGIGSTNNTELGDPAVSTHIDGVYIPRPRGVGSMVFDLERVELNRGPQGTVRGRNAIGGALNLVTNKPKLGEFGAKATVGVGNYSQRTTEAMVNIPIGDTLAVRLATFSEVHSPFYKNAGPIRTLEAAESADVLAYRASVKWQPFEALTINVMHDYTQEGGTGYGGSNFNEALEAGILPEEVPDPRAIWYRGAQASQDMKHWGIMGSIGLDLGPASIEYLGSYRNLDYQQITPGNSGVDYHGKVVTDTQLDNWGTSYWHSTSEAVVQELRLIAPDDSWFRWTVGGFFFNEEQQGFLGSTADQSTGFAGVEYTMPDMHSDAWAAFADATVDVTDFLRVIAGFRYTGEQKERTGIGHVYGFTNINSPFRFGTEGFRWAEWDRTDYTAPEMPAAPFPQFVNGVERFGIRDTIDEVLLQPGVGQWGNNLNAQKGDSDYKYPDFRVGAELDVTDQNLLYATFTTGHKAGGFNDSIRVGGVYVQPRFKPETLYSLEIGSKNEFNNREVIVNASAFWYSYQDQQFQSIVQVASGDNNSLAATSVISNAASSRVLGLEADVKWRLPAGFEANVAALLLNARFTDGEVADTRVAFGAAQPIVDLEGNALLRSPTIALNYSLSQTIPTSIGYFDWLISAQTKSKYYMTVFNGEGKDPEGNVNPSLSDVVPAYTRLDGSIGFTHIDGRFRLETFMSNITNVAYMNSIINTPDLNLRFFNAPRQYGARLTVYL